MLSLIANATVLNINNKDINFQKDIPKWVKYLFFMVLYTYILNLEFFFKFEKIIFKLGPFVGMKKMNFHEIESEIKKIEYEYQNESVLFNNQDLKQLIYINNKMSKICNDLNERALNENKMIKLKYAATFLDKIFFYLALIAFFVTFVSTILTTPNLYQ